MEKNEDIEETQTISPLDLDEENENKKKKPSKKTLTLPWLKPRDSCELGLLALGR